MKTTERGYFDALTEGVLGAVFEVSNTLGAGLLLHELRLRGIRAAAEASFPVTYKGHGVGEYFADLLVEDALVIELKCDERLSNEHTAQCLNSHSERSHAARIRYPSSPDIRLVPNTVSSDTTRLDISAPPEPTSSPRLLRYAW